MVNAPCLGYTYKDNTLKYISQAQGVKFVIELFVINHLTRNTFL